MQINTTDKRKRKCDSYRKESDNNEGDGFGGDGGGGGGGGDWGGDGADNDHQCQFCFLTPCIADSNRNAPWLGQGQAPSNANPSIRKGLYRRFWKCINNSGGWLIPRYLAKKSTMGGGQYAVMHRREIMPDCVLELIRTLYPNPNGIPYMGHMWE